MTNNTFEEKLKLLEMTVRKLEENDLSLDESKKLYKEGIKLSKECKILLNKTREDYASKEDLRYTSNRIVETLNRLEDKLDKVLSK